MVEDFRVARYFQLSAQNKQLVDRLPRRAGTRLLRDYAPLVLLHEGSLVSALWITRGGHVGYAETVDANKATLFGRRHGRSPLEELLIHAVHEHSLSQIGCESLTSRARRAANKMFGRFNPSDPSLSDIFLRALTDSGAIVLPRGFTEKFKPVIPRLETE